MKYGLNDIAIVPAANSDISSRSECYPYDKNEMLPLFTAPMSSVVGIENYQLFQENKIYPIIPRTVPFSDRIGLYCKMWVAFSLEEFISITQYDEKEQQKTKMVVIDIANGNMIKLHNAIKEAKRKYGDSIKIMAGNIANPETYAILSDCGVDYVRVGIGGGHSCITSSRTGVHYPMASLIEECHEVSSRLKSPAYIVADGGITNYSDIIKSLACGADYVMCGSIFNRMLESSGRTTIDSCNASAMHVDQYSEDAIDIFFNGEYKLVKEFYGMSTHKAQTEIALSTKIDNENPYKTSEGIYFKNIVEYTMSEWVNDFTNYLRSAMSYTSSHTLDDFIGEPSIITISNNVATTLKK